MAPGALHRVVYLSTAVGVLRADELDRIYLRAQAANTGSGITGLLLFWEGTFLQALEGPAAGLSSLLQKIRRDRRHSGLITLESRPCAERTFSASMQYISGRNLSAGEKQAFGDLRLAVAARSTMSSAPASGADNGLWAFLASFAQARAA